MSMIDYLIRTDTIDQMKAVIPYLYHEETDSWGPSCFLCDVYDNSVPETPRKLNFVFLWVCKSYMDLDLSAKPECVLIADREAAEAGLPFMIFAQQFEAGLYVYTVSPTVAGSNYPFGDV